MKDNPLEIITPPWLDHHDGAEAVAAWFDLLSEVESVKKDSTADVGKYDYGYTSLPALFRYVKPLALKHGFVLSHDFKEGFNGHPSVRVEFLRRNGIKIVSGWMTMAAPADPQKQGAAISYGKRYSTQAFLGMVTEDDDAKSAANQPTNIDPPERLSIQEWMKERSSDERKAYGKALQERYRSKLADIPVERLGEVMEFTREFLANLDAQQQPRNDGDQEAFKKLNDLVDELDGKERAALRKLCMADFGRSYEALSRTDVVEVQRALEHAVTAQKMGPMLADAEAGG